MTKSQITSHMTRRLLADSLKNLMQTRSLTKITVREIVDGCKLNRQTFYYHFQDIYELAEWMFKQDALSLMDRHNDWTTWQEGVKAILDFIRTNEKICLSAYQSVSRELLRQFFYSDILNLFREGIEAAAVSRDITRDEKDFVAHFYTVAFAGVTEHWIIDGMKESPEILVHYLSAMVEGGIEGVFSQFESMRQINEIRPDLGRQA